MSRRLRLFLIEQNLNNDYDTYDSAVVCAETSEEARAINPDGKMGYDDKDEYPHNKYASWVAKEYVKIREIGIADKSMQKGVVCCSFNAG